MPTLSVCCDAYDRTWPLIAGRIGIAGVDLDWHCLVPEESFLRGLVEHEFAIAEMSLSTYVLQLSRGENAYTALPVFLSRAFRHGAIYIRGDAGIEKPEDLKGRAIGVPEYQLTANVWARGILADEYGVGTADVTWAVGGLDEPGRDEKVALDLSAAGIEAAPIGPEDTLGQMMARGEIDAIIAPHAPKAFWKNDGSVTHLWADVAATERAYYKKTGNFPIMHMLGIRNAELQAMPELAGKLYDAFSQARDEADERIRRVAYYTTMLPWLPDHVAETRAVMGDDFWPYGVDANRTCLETFLRYSSEQGIAARPVALEELFAPGVE